jgi:hypothetical protein
MTSNRRLTGLGIALAATAALFAAALAPVGAQTAAPYTAYGIGMRPGAMIAANIAGRSCGPAVAVTAAGTWLMYIAQSAPCTPNERDLVSFTVDGVTADQTISWTVGGAPADPATGIALTVTTTTAAGAGTPAGVGFAGGTIAPSGISIVTFTGNLEQLNTASAAAKVASVTVLSNGKPVTFIVGAPAFVNSEFTAAFPTGLKGTLVIVVV